MFKRLRCGAFLLAEQLVALTILGVVVASLVAVTEQVGVKRRQLEQNLVASRWQRGRGPGPLSVTRP